MDMLRTMAVLQVRDLQASVAYYNRLGFKTNGIWGDPAAFAILQRGQVTIGFERIETPPDTGASWSAYIYVTDANALHAEFVDAGATIHREPMDRFYGCRDFETTDPDGHRLCFGQDMQPTHGPGLAKEEPLQ